MYNAYAFYYKVRRTNEIMLVNGLCKMLLNTHCAFVQLRRTHDVDKMHSDSVGSTKSRTYSRGLSMFLLVYINCKEGFHCDISIYTHIMYLIKFTLSIALSYPSPTF
jgi:hypothetical protein